MKTGSSAYILIALLSAVSLTAATLIATPGHAGDTTYNYFSPADLKVRIESDAPVTVVDIQVKEEFDQHHIQGAVATYAYPVKFPADRAMLESTFEQIASGSDPVVIVCPRGGGGARRTYEYFVGKGISADRLFILKGGQAGWPYGELLE